MLLLRAAVCFAGPVRAGLARLPEAQELRAAAGVAAGVGGLGFLVAVPSI